MLTASIQRLLLVVALQASRIAAWSSLATRHSPRSSTWSFRSPSAVPTTRLHEATDLASREPSAIVAPLTDDSLERPGLVRRYYENFLWNLTDTTATDCDTPQQYRINYRVEGPVDGPPILLVHGFGANVNHFRFQFPALVAEGFRVYAIDLLGFGASEKPPDAPYSIELFTQLLVDFIRAMSQSRADTSSQDPSWIVAGNSIGGLCSLNVAKEVPQWIRGVVLLNCAGGMTGFRYEDVPWYLQPLLWFVQKIVLGPQWGGRFFADFKTRQNVESILKQQGVYRNTTHVNEELLEILLGPADDPHAEDVFLKTFAGPPGPTPESILPLITCPVLAIWGGHDPWTPVDAGMHPGNGFAQYAATDFVLEVLPNVGHCPHDEAPEQVHAVMLPWIQRLEAQSIATEVAGEEGRHSNNCT